MEVLTDFFFLGSKITADGDCSHEIRRQLLLGRKAVTDLDSIYSADKGPYSQGCGLPIGHVSLGEVVCKEGRAPRIYAFKLWCWRRLLRIPWTAKRSNQSVLREVNPKYSLEGLMLKLKLQYFGHLYKQLTH